MNNIDHIFTLDPVAFASAYVKYLKTVLEAVDPAEVGRFINTLLDAFEFAASAGIKTVAITAFDGGKMKPMADEGIHVPTGAKEYGPAEDAHMVLDHLVGAYLMRYIKVAQG